MKISAPTLTLVALLLACASTPFVSGQAAGNPDTANQIRTGDFESRDKVIADVETSLQTTRDAVAAARSRASELRAEAREQYQAAIETFRQRDTQIRDSLRAVRMASRDEYQAAREKLASDYEAFVAAAADVQANGEAKLSRN